MTKITLSGGTTFELSTEQLRELGTKIAEAVEGKAEDKPEFKLGELAVALGESKYENIKPKALVKIIELEKRPDGFNTYVENVVTESRGFMRPEDLRHATAEEVAQYERNRIFTENGRKPNEYRKGDIVIYVGGASTYGLPVEVYKDTEDGLTAIKWHDTVGLGVCSEMHDAITPLVFVEQRLDRKH